MRFLVTIRTPQQAVSELLQADVIVPPDSPAGLPACPGSFSNSLFPPVYLPILPVRVLLDMAASPDPPYATT